MTDPTSSTPDLHPPLSRRKMLRHSAITAAGAVLLPSLLSGCTKSIWEILNGNVSTPTSPTWIGGFAQSNPAFAYPNPDLSSLPMLKNMDNIQSLDRQQAANWPEFSWESEKSAADPGRCFQMFAPDISRVGYTNTGRIYSIICPQQGACSDVYGCMNVEVSVTGQRGWVDENTRQLAADMTVEGKIWFSNSGLNHQTIQDFLKIFTTRNLPFPSNKDNAIVVSTHLPGNPNQPIFPLRSGETKLFTSPDFAHHKEAWAVASIDVEIGPIVQTSSAIVNRFNGLVMEFFNLASGNLLQQGNVLSWNVYLNAPALVDRAEWQSHAERWRDSIDVEHGHGSGTIARYFDGTAFDAAEAAIQAKIDEIIAWLKSI